MRMRWGTYLHEDQEVKLTRYYKRAVLSRRGLRERLRVGMQFKIRVLGDSISDLAAKTVAIETEYAVDGKDAVLLNDDGSESQYVLKTNHPNAITGVRVLDFSWIDENPAEIVNNRTAVVHLEADYFDAFTGILEYFETIRFSGNTGPRWRYKEFPEADPIKVQQQRKTIQWVIQSGHSLGLAAYVQPQGSLWPNDEHQDLQIYEPYSPTFNGYALSGYGLRWAFYHSLTTDNSGQRPTVPSFI